MSVGLRYAARGKLGGAADILGRCGGLVRGGAWWLLVGGGLVAVGRVMGWLWSEGDAVRRVSLAVARSVYFVRLLFTQFVFLKLALGWSEAGADERHVDEFG